MSREWQPGDMARTRRGGTVARTAIHKWVLLDDGHAVNLDHEPRPLVVIDPEDREQVERLRDILTPPGAMFRHGCGEIEAALREFANPTPVEVFEHFVLEATNCAPPLQSVCGKVWAPNDNSVSVGTCPECEAIVDAGWVK